MLNGMNKLVIEGSEANPTIILDPEGGIFKIEGRSIPDDGKAFYDPVIEWLDHYCKNPIEETHFEFNLEFFNISSSKMLLFILYKLNEIKHAGKDVRITWYYGDDDDDMQEVGEDYAYMVNLPFVFLPDPERRKKDISIGAQ